jgi:hypothetical protein
VLAREISDLIPEVVAAGEQCGYRAVEPVTVLRYRFPPVGNLFGDFESIRGEYVHNTLAPVLAETRRAHPGEIVDQDALEMLPCRTPFAHGAV